MLKILKYPDPRLKEMSREVSEFDSEFRKLLDAIAETMYASNGVGLAAPQVGRTLRAFVIDISPQDERHKRLYEIVNPRISNGEGKIVFEEGCLSIPGVTEPVERKLKITVDYQDRFGELRQMTAEELLAVAIQHENDHLDGILFIDRLSPLKRKLMKRKLSKAVTL